MTQIKLLELIALQQSLMLATANAEGLPMASYAPFVFFEDMFFIYTSSLARHTPDLLAKTRASIMIIEDEDQATSIFARRRLSITANVSAIERDDAKHPVILDRFALRFGKTFNKLIRPLDDFVLFRLQPENGLYVEGFGKAFKFEGSFEQMTHVTGK